MELITCSECKNSISSVFYTCVYCGYSRKKGNSGVYYEYLPCVHLTSSHYNGKCRLIVTKSNWKVVYCFRGHQKHTRTKVEIDGSRIDEYIQALKDCFVNYEVWDQLPLEELIEVTELSEYFECSAKEYPIRLNRSSIAYSDCAPIKDIFGSTNLEIIIDTRYLSNPGVLLDGHHEIRIDCQSELDSIISTLIFAHERALIVMPVIKIL